MSGATPELIAVLDTNLIVSGTILPRSVPSRVLATWQRNAFTLIASRPLVAEAADVLTRDAIQLQYGLDAAIIDQLLDALSARVIRPVPLDALPVHCRDPKDDMILACALGGGADYIVTGDADLLVLDGHPALPGLRIVTPRAFLALLEG